MWRPNECDCRCEPETPIPCAPAGTACGYPIAGVSQRCVLNVVSGWSNIQPPKKRTYLGSAFIKATAADQDERICVVDELGDVWVTDSRSPWETWNLAYQHGSALNDVAFYDSLRGVVVGNGGAVLVTNDGGATWSTASSGTSSNLYSVKMIKGVAMACGDGGAIIKSTDYGVTWSALSSGTSANLRAIDLRKTRAWACGGAALLRSTDLVTWSAISGISEEMTAVAFWSETDGVVVATTANGVVGGTTGTPHLTLRLWRSLDHGATWTNEFLYQAAVGPSDLYASHLVASSATRYDCVASHHVAGPAGKTRLWVTSDDAGDTWQFNVATVSTPSQTQGVHWRIARSERGAACIVGESLGYPNLWNPFCGVGASPVGWTINPIGGSVHDYCATAFAGNVPLLNSSPLSAACIWNSYDMSGPCSWSLDISGSDAALTLTAAGGTCSYAKPMSEWEIDGANVLTLSGFSGAEPNITEVILCPTGIIHCVVCDEWNHYEITIPAIATYTSGGTEDATWISGTSSGSTSVCTWETTNAIDGSKAYLVISKTVTGSGTYYIEGITWGVFSWVRIGSVGSPLPSPCITDTLPQNAGPASAADASYVVA